ncbi:hypothetical protein RFI_06839 [Reticulomyxa filosa]|uniref:Uncharacterized protein n=1 Tax=Reticulomyxa filosa TaxID=46433 RepID=X6NWS7_RETFI|nr:hypothetical protein RFI_06839 [Reticulomyxa filosa]|eukprot:ETO30284.1 hypothetical protein RFI_06839 [Reticulomyxa filosa]
MCNFVIATRPPLKRESKQKKKETKYAEITVPSSAKYPGLFGHRVHKLGVKVLYVERSINYLFFFFQKKKKKQECFFFNNIIIIIMKVTTLIRHYNNIPEIKHTIIKKRNNLVSFLTRSTDDYSWTHTKDLTILEIWCAIIQSGLLLDTSIASLPTMSRNNNDNNNNNSSFDSNSKDSSSFPSQLLTNIAQIILKWQLKKSGGEDVRLYLWKLQQLQIESLIALMEQYDPMRSRIHPSCAFQVLLWITDTIDVCGGDLLSRALYCATLVLPYVANGYEQSLELLTSAAWYEINKSSLGVSKYLDLLLLPSLFDKKEHHNERGGIIRQNFHKVLQCNNGRVLQLFITHICLLWHKYPDIALLYIDDIIKHLCHCDHHAKSLDTEDVVYRDEYLFGCVAMFLGAMCCHSGEKHHQFVVSFLTFCVSLLTYLKKVSRSAYLEPLHIRCWEFVWHVCGYVKTSYGWEQKEIQDLLCNLSEIIFSDSSISTDQRQWVTLILVKIIRNTRFIDSLFGDYKIFKRRTNAHVWLMYALGETMMQMTQQYSIDKDYIDKKELLDIHVRVLRILVIWTSHNFGQIRSGAQYYLLSGIQSALSLDDSAKALLGDVILSIHDALIQSKEAITLRDRMKVVLQWLRSGDMLTPVAEATRPENAIESIRNRKHYVTTTLVRHYQPVFDSQLLSDCFQHDIAQLEWLLYNRQCFIGGTRLLQAAVVPVFTALRYEYGMVGKETRNRELHTEREQQQQQQQHAVSLQKDTSKHTTTEEKQNDKEQSTSETNTGPGGYQRKIDPVMTLIEEYCHESSQQVKYAYQ